MQIPVEIYRDEYAIRGTLHLAPSTKKTPVVLMFHCFTCDRNAGWFRFVMLSRRLEKEGISSLRFDFMGSGESDGEFYEMTPLTEAKDAEAVASYARSRPELDPDNLFVVSLSMGGLVAALTAHKIRPKAMVLWNPSGTFNPVQDMELLKKNGKAPGSGMYIGKEFVDVMQSIDPYYEASKYKGKVLIVRGTLDEIVSDDVINSYLKAYSGAEIYKIEGADHNFSRMDWAEIAINATVSYIKSHVA
ncbi:alpha/beta hydrolase [Tardisphaera miroshnichenkoae]